MTPERQAEKLMELHAAKTNTLKTLEYVFKKRVGEGKLDMDGIRESERDMVKLQGEAWGVVDAAIALGFTVDWDVDGAAVFEPMPEA